MKVFIKIGLVVLALGGVLYWLGGKFLQPARRLHDKYKKTQNEDITV